MESGAFMGWACNVRWTKRSVDSMGVPIEWHVRHRNMTFEGTMRHGVAVKRIRVFDFVVQENAEHVRDCCIGKIGCEHAASVLEFGDVMTLMSGAGRGLIRPQRSVGHNTFNLAA